MYTCKTKIHLSLILNFTNFAFIYRTAFENDHDSQRNKAGLHLLSFPSKILEIILKVVLTDCIHVHYTLVSN